MKTILILGTDSAFSRTAAESAHRQIHMTSIKASRSESSLAIRLAGRWTTGRALSRSTWANILRELPTVVVQNMPGAGTIIAANHVYNIAKPDGLTLGLVNPAVYIDQLLRATEVKFDWPKFSYIGSPERIDQVLFMRADGPYKTLEDIRKAAEPPRCAAQARTTPSYFFPKLIEEGLGLKDYYYRRLRWRR